MLVKLTAEGDQPWYVNPDHVMSLIEAKDGKTLVMLPYESTFARYHVIVLGNIDEVAAKLNGEDPCKS